MKRELVRVAFLALLTPLAFLASGQSTNAPTESPQPLRESGMLLTLKNNQAEIEVSQSFTKPAKKMKFLINERTKLGKVASGTVVMVTYVKVGSKLVAMALDVPGAAMPAGAAILYGTANLAPSKTPAPHPGLLDNYPGGLSTGPPIPSTETAYNNDRIIKLVKAGIPDDLIVSIINEHPRNYDTSVESVNALKTAGASDRVVSAIIIGPALAPHASPQTEATYAPEMNNPNAPHDPGIYMRDTSGEGRVKVVPVSRARILPKSSALMSFLSIETPHVFRVAGRRAALRTTEKRPVFYLYLPKAGDDEASEASETAGRLYLVTLNGKEGYREGYRETTVIERPFPHSRTPGLNEGDLKVHEELVAPSTLELTPDADLKPGEYAFVSLFEKGSVRPGDDVVVFDFGIDPK